jgi:putative membrane-bound dehydrogenase-like protein
MRWLPRLLFGLSLIALPSASLAQVPPEKVLSTFKVSDGLEISLWASEPLFVNPTCMDIDHKGRVWVCESVNYRHRLHHQPPRRPAGDRIVILEDSKGTGKADKATTFYQSKDLLAPLGIAVAKDPVGPGYKVYVCQSPDILVFEDKDGDGKADGPPRKLLTGFGGFDHDHGVHGILIGPDMKLYFSVGDTGVHGLVGKNGKKKWHSNSTDCRAGTIWRCDLDGSNLELIAHNFRNEYEPCVDSFGTVFVSDNDDDGNQQTRICYVMPGGNYGYHPRGPNETHWHEEQPGVVPKILRTYFGSPTGMCVYEGTLLPKKYQGQLLHTDAGPRHVRCYHLTPDGAGYAVDREDMVTSTDNWFRPSDICVSPDGSTYVADWYDPGVGGHGMGDITRGRIYRIAPTGKKPYLPKVNLATTKGLLNALGSPAISVRYMAMAQIQSKEASQEIWDDLVNLATDNSAKPWLRARALWQLGLQGKRFKKSNSAEVLLQLAPIVHTFGNKDPRFRCLAIRIWKDCYGVQPVLQEKADLQSILEDPSPAVRREALIALRDIDPKIAKPYIIELARRYDGKDRFYLEAIGIAVGHHDKARRAVILADFDKQFPEWNEKVAGLVWELRPPQVMPLLEKRLANRALPAEQRKRIVEIVASSPEPAAGKLLLKALSVETSAEVREQMVASLKLNLPTRWKDLASSTELSAAVKNLLGRSKTQRTALTLIAAAQKADAIADVAYLARNLREPLELRTQALRTLSLFKTPEATGALLKELTTAEPASLRTEAASALGRQGTPDAMKALQKLVTFEKASHELKQAAVTALAGTRSGSMWLLAAHERKELPAALKDDVARLLRNSPFQPVRNKALVAFPPPGRLDLKKLPSIAKLAGRKGNADHGRQLVLASLNSNLQCLRCHTIRGLGGNVGPDLSVIGKKASRENLLESIIYPSKAIADQYVTTVVETVKGETISGLLIEETPQHILLRDGNGKDYKIPKKDIDSRAKSQVSIMPADLLAYMTEDDLVDIVDYLYTLKTPALTLDYWHIAGPFENGKGDAGMERVFGPEKKVDLRATYPGKSGRVAWRTVRPDAKNYVDLRTFLGSESNNVVSYLYREVESPAGQEARIYLGTDDCAKLWLNGRLVYESRQHRAAAPEQDVLRGHLKKGRNTLLLKINNGDGDHGFYLTVVAEQELRKIDLKGRGR